jgi:hypothetical protein
MDIRMRQTTLAESLLLKGEYCGQGVLLLSTCLVESNRSTRGVFLLPADAKRPGTQQLQGPRLTQIQKSDGVRLQQELVDRVN